MPCHVRISGHRVGRLTPSSALPRLDFWCGLGLFRRTMSWTSVCGCSPLGRGKRIGTFSCMYYGGTFMQGFSYRKCILSFLPSGRPLPREGAVCMAQPISQAWERMKILWLLPCTMPASSGPGAGREAGLSQYCALTYAHRATFCHSRLLSGADSVCNLLLVLYGGKLKFSGDTGSYISMSQDMGSFCSQCCGPFIV